MIDLENLSVGNVRKCSDAELVLLDDQLHILEVSGVQKDVVGPVHAVVTGVMLGRGIEHGPVQVEQVETIDLDVVEPVVEVAEGATTIVKRLLEDRYEYGWDPDDLAYPWWTETSLTWKAASELAGGTLAPTSDDARDHWALYWTRKALLGAEVPTDLPEWARPIDGFSQYDVMVWQAGWAERAAVLEKAARVGFAGTETLRVCAEFGVNPIADIEVEVVKSVWSQAMMNDLPDSSFLYIEPGGKKDSGGKTVPRSLRHFPYRDASGKVDKPHLRNALARIPQSSLSASAKAEALRRARAAAGPAGISVSKRIEAKVFSGMPIRVEHPKGYIQNGIGPDGKAWARVFQNDYGYLPKTQGGDGECLDCYLGPNQSAKEAFWIRQQRPNGEFDEYKVMLGFDSAPDAKAAYLAHVPKWAYGGMSSMPMDRMRAMAGQDPTTAPMPREPRMSKTPSGVPTVVHTDKPERGLETWHPSQHPMPGMTKDLTLRISKALDRQIVTGPVMVPEEIDGQGDVESAVVIEQAAHRFLQEYNRTAKLGHQHRFFDPNQMKLIESWVLKEPWSVGGQDLPIGTWMMSVQVADSGLWADIKAGRVNGFSIGAAASGVRLTT